MLIKGIIKIMRIFCSVGLALSIVLQNPVLVCAQKHLATSSLFGHRYVLPRTPEEAVAQWQEYAQAGVVPDSPLHKPVEIRFYVTTDTKGWHNPLTGDSGLYGKVLPPVVLEDGRSIIPVVGNFHEVVSIGVQQDPEIRREVVELKEAYKLIEKYKNDKKVDFKKEYDRINQNIMDLFRAARYLEDFIPSDLVGGLREDRPRKRVSVSTLKLLLTVLDQTEDSVLRNLLQQKKLNFQELITLPDAQFLDTVPGRVFYHADQVLWNQYYDRNAQRIEVQETGRVRWQHHEHNLLYEKWKIQNAGQTDIDRWFYLANVPDEDYATVACSMFEEYTKLEDYLPEISFSQASVLNSEIVDDYEEQEVVSTQTLCSLLWILYEREDSKLHTFLETIGIPFESLIALSHDKLVALVPGSLFLRADDIHWEEYHQRKEQEASCIPFMERPSHYYHVFRLGHERIRVYPHKWLEAGGKRFDRAMVELFERYKVLGDYLDVSFSVEKVSRNRDVSADIVFALDTDAWIRSVRDHAHKPAVSLSTQKLRELLQVLQEMQDAVLGAFKGHKQVIFEELLRLERDFLLEQIPERIWLRAYQVCLQRYKEQHAEVLGLDVLEDIFYKVIKDDKYLGACDAVNRAHVSGLQQKYVEGMSVKVYMQKVPEEQMQNRFGLVPVHDEQGDPLTMQAHTFEDVVGRLNFVYGPGGFIEARDADGKCVSIDSSSDLLCAVANGLELVFIPGVLELKALGTIQPKFYGFVSGTRSVHLGEEGTVFHDSDDDILRENGFWSGILEEAKYTIMLEIDGERHSITVEDLKDTQGMYFGTRYQPGFPSGTGLQIKEFSDKGMIGEHRLQFKGGQSPYHTVAQYKFVQESAGEPVAAELRFSRCDAQSVPASKVQQLPVRSMRIAEAIEEYKRDVDNSTLGKWKKQGDTFVHDQLRNFFIGFGKNQRALLSTGKVWINVGGRIMHFAGTDKFVPLNETYQFFLKNTDIIDGRQADLGDFLTVEQSLNENYEDFRESVAICVAMVSQFIYDLAEVGIIADSEVLRRELLGFFAQGFSGRNIVAADAIHLVQMNFTKVNVDTVCYPEYSRRPIVYTDGVYKRTSLSNEFELFLRELCRDLSDITEGWHLRSLGYVPGLDATQYVRNNPYDETGEPQLTIIPELVQKHPVLRAIFTIQEQGSANFLQVALDMFSQVPSEMQEQYTNIVNYLIAIHEALSFQKNTVYIGDRTMSLSEALQRLNGLRAGIMLESASTFDLEEDASPCQAAV